MKTSAFMLLLFICSQSFSYAANTAGSFEPSKEISTPGGYKLLAQWMEVHLNAIHNSKVPSHHFRQLAYISTALYESIVAADPNYVSLGNQLNNYSVIPVTPNTKDF
jgi:hypothetical protein